jgi:2-polyprenyl-3-methyl-5-hydroxy-6-metoxy-1,4-benzoquinol methylase
MARNTQHELLTSPSPDIRARQRFVLALKRNGEQLRRRFVAKADVVAELRPGSSDTRLEDAITSLYSENAYRAICTVKRAGQEMMWDTIEDSIEAELPRLQELYEETRARPVGGSLTLNETLEAGEEWNAARVHLQPGGYLRNRTPNDLMAGALYEEGGALYSRGQGVGTKESKAECIIRFLEGWKPDFQPTRILDVACSAGASSVPYALAYPNAEVHAIDIGEGLLRYAHARAQSIGAPVHFHQMNAERIDFPDESFDLIVSHNAMHEMSARTQQAMFDETHRLLRPGGICIHQDLPLKFSDMTMIRQADIMFDEWYNGELHWSEYAQTDCRAGLERAGFAPEAIHCEPFPLLDKTMSWLLAAAQKSGERATS